LGITISKVAIKQCFIHAKGKCGPFVQNEAAKIGNFRMNPDKARIVK
jgi:hypothetical protein